MQRTNTLVIGLGIAGALVAFLLHQLKIPFIVMDPGNTNTSSRIAAGMFAPVSGRRKTIHPLVALQIPYAIKLYKEIEQLLGRRFLHMHHIYQVSNSIKEHNDMAIKSVNPDFARYILADPLTLPALKQEMGAYEITHSGWVDCALLINGFARWLKQKDALIESGFIYEDIQISKEEMEYHGLSFSNIIFCEGYQAINNPFFNKENIIPCKGNMLTIEYDQFVTDRIIKKNGIYIIPAGNNKFRAGSTYQWNNSSTSLDEAGKKLIEGQLDAMLANSYCTIDHQTAIRPTTQNRELIAKQHPVYRGMYMLNGLGTRGVLQGPWGARLVLKLLFNNG